MKSKIKKILLIDDDKEFLSNIETLFELEEKCDFSLAVSNSGSVGLEAAQKRPYDLTVIDICMDDIDGFSVCEELLKNQIDTRVVLISSIKIDTETAINSIKVGACDFVSKHEIAKDFTAFLNRLRRNYLVENTLKYNTLDEKKKIANQIKKNEELQLMVDELNKKLNARNSISNLLYLLTSSIIVIGISFISMQKENLAAIFLVALLLIILLGPISKIEYFKGKLIGMLDTSIKFQSNKKKKS